MVPTQLQETLSHLKVGLRLGVTVGLFAGLYFPTGRNERLRMNSVQSQSPNWRKRLLAPGMMGGEKVLKETHALQGHIVQASEERGKRIFWVWKLSLQLEGCLLVLIWFNSLDQRSSIFLTPETGFTDNGFKTSGWGRGDGLGITQAHDIYRALYSYCSIGSTSAQVLDPRGGDTPV